MSIIRVSFLLFLFAVMIAYYCVPKRMQWMVLLAGSAVFYLWSGAKTSVYILITASSVYGAARWLDALAARQKAYLKENKETLDRAAKAAYKDAMKKRRRAVLTACIVLNFGILFALKYFGFALDSLNAVLKALKITPIENTSSLIVPLGISFYTLQAVGYLVEVYWENAAAEKNYFRTLLFVTFFPQITQGPISAYSQLAPQLFAEHDFKYENYARGFQRLLWGLMKKMVLANLLQPYIANIFRNYMNYAGITVLLGIFAYSLQIYADFSGYMDIMCGACEMLDIRLTENFVRPYLSQNYSEYWRRWHITLGEWFKKYVYYPIAIAKWNRKLGTRAKTRLGKLLPATIALVITWFATGLWHGASWGYIAWGGINGAILILSMWLEPFYERCRTALKMRDESRGWKAFRIARTFLLIAVIKVLPEVGSLRGGVRLILRAFTNFSLPRSFGALIPFGSKMAFFPGMLLAAALLIASDFIGCRVDLRERFNRLPIAARIALLTLLFFLVAAFGIPASSNMRGFMYANF